MRKFDPTQTSKHPTNNISTAGGGSYYFAKKSINADRAHRHEEKMRQQQLQANLEQREKSIPPKKGRNGSDHAGSPSAEASHDPAPTRHAPETEAQRIAEKSKYEASEPYRSRKGDRFS